MKTSLTRASIRGTRVGRVAAPVLVAVTVMTLGAASASAVAPAGPGRAGHGSGRAGHGPGTAGTASAKVSSGEHARFLHLRKSASEAASGDLSTVLTATGRGGYTAAGIGMRNLGFGAISITGVPDGATVKSATLMWDVLADQADPTFAQGTFDGTPITGTAWATGDSPCWPTAGNFSYEADVTSLVTGNGDYNLAGFATGESDGADPWNDGSTPPLLEGASLVVIYQDDSMPDSFFQIAEGATETDSGNSAEATLSGFTASMMPTVTTTYIVADGQESGNTASFNGTVLPDVSFPGGDPQAVPDYSMGNLWDTATTDVSSLVNSGDTSATLDVTGGGDCLVWVGQVLDVSGPVLAALGDSYSSGEAAGDYYPGTGGAHGCHRSPNGWAVLLPSMVTSEDLTLPHANFLACSGAVSDDLFNPFKGQQPQIDALEGLNPAPGLITMTMGGNDLGFSDVLKDCYIGNCVTDGRLKAVEKQLPQERGILENDYLALEDADPSATILIVGYPKIFEQKTWCEGIHFSKHGWGFSPTEEVALNKLTSKFDAMIASAAGNEDVRFVSDIGALSGHRLCEAHSWVADVGFLKQFFGNSQEQGHPTARGQKAIARMVAAYINNNL